MDPVDQLPAPSQCWTLFRKHARTDSTKRPGPPPRRLSLSYWFPRTRTVPPGWVAAIQRWGSVRLYREDMMRSICNSMRKTAIPLCGLLALAVSSCGGGGSGSGSTAQPLTVTAQILYSFGGTSTDAMGPSGVLIQGSDGNFYGTTYRGGLTGCGEGTATSDPFVIGCGTVFKISPTGEETVLHLFAAGSADGTNPNVLIQGSDGNFYGT